jgi:asparagine synthetase B (glutamine-hydrolysing)
MGTTELLISQPKSVEILGAPVLSGRMLTASDKEFAALTTIEDYRGLARRIRGSFSIIVREADATTVITDHAGCFPVFYLVESAGPFRVSSTLWDLRKYSSGKLSLKALFFYAVRKSIGDDPLYADVRTVGRGRVVRFSGKNRTETAWLDWESFLEERPLSPAEARDRFMEIASECLTPFTRSGDGIACLLSSGTDSAVCAYVLKRLCPGIVCLSADYRIRRYSECALASVHARRIGVQHRRILVTLGDHRRALLAMNSRCSDLPARHSQLTSLHRLAEHARDEGIRYLVSAEFAGGLFMEFRPYFDAFATNEDYLRHVAGLSIEQKLESIVDSRALNQSGEELLAAMGCSPEQCRSWIDSMQVADRAIFEPWVRKFPFPLLLQLSAQIWVGVRFQNAWLPAQRAVGGGVQFVDPFLDIEMIRFAMSLPLRFKWNNGTMKALLRDVLEASTGIRAPKRASPNPTRVWSMLSGFRDSLLVDARLRDLHRKRTLLNLGAGGRNYESLLDTAALGIWLRAHALGETEGGCIYGGSLTN